MPVMYLSQKLENNALYLTLITVLYALYLLPPLP